LAQAFRSGSGVPQSSEQKRTLSHADSTFRQRSWPSRSKRTKTNAKAGPSRNSTVGRQPGTLIPGRVMGRLSGPFQRDSVTLKGSPEIGRFRGPRAGYPARLTIEAAPMTIVIGAIRPSTVFAPVAVPDRPRAIPGRNRVVTATPSAEHGNRQAAGGLPPQTEPPGVFATEVLGTCHELTPGLEARNQPSRVAAVARLVLPCANPRLTKGSIAAAACGAFAGWWATAVMRPYLRAIDPVGYSPVILICLLGGMVLFWYLHRCSQARVRA
jgi:hypothetical protein